MGKIFDLLQTLANALTVEAKSRGPEFPRAHYKAKMEKYKRDFENKIDTKDPEQRAKAKQIYAMWKQAEYTYKHYHSLQRGHKIAANDLDEAHEGLMDKYNILYDFHRKTAKLAKRTIESHAPLPQHAEPGWRKKHPLHSEMLHHYEQRNKYWKLLTGK